MQVGFGWDVDPHLEPKVAGFQLFVDGQPVGRVLPKTARYHASIDKLQPGQTINVSLAAVASDNTPVGMSNVVKVKDLYGSELMF
jgi:hypothetical protein